MMSFAIFAFEFLVEPLLVRGWVIMGLIVLIVMAFLLGDANGSRRRRQIQTTRMEEEKQISERMILEGIVEERVEQNRKNSSRKWKPRLSEGWKKR